MQSPKEFAEIQNLTNQSYWIIVLKLMPHKCHTKILCVASRRVSVSRLQECEIDQTDCLLSPTGEVLKHHTE